MMTREERLKAAQDRTKQNYETKGQFPNSGKNVLDYSKIGGWKKELIFKPKVGWNKIDIIPYVVKTKNHPSKLAPGTPDYLLDIWVHRFVGASGSTFLCLKSMYGKPCPICEERERMKTDPSLPEDAYKKLFPKRRTIYNVINLDLPENNQPIQLYEDVYSWFEEPMLEIVGLRNVFDFWDFETGKSIEFLFSEKKTPEGTSHKCGQFSFLDRPAYKESICSEAYCLDELLVIPTYEEVRNAMLSIDDDEPIAEDTRSRTETPPASSSRRAEPTIQEEIQGEERTSRRRERTREEVPEDNPCPFGHKFGIDNEMFSKEGHCTKCDQKVYNDCADLHDQLEKVKR